MREQKISEMIDREDGLDPVDRGFSRELEDSRIVEEHVERPLAGEEVPGEIADRLLRRKVGDHYLAAAAARILADLAREGFAPLTIPTHEHEVRPESPECERRRAADAGRRTGDP